MSAKKGTPVPMSAQTLKRTTGSLSRGFGTRVLNSALSATDTDWRDQDSADHAIDGTVAVMTGAQPRTELEGMLIAQMIAAHETAMACYRRAQLDGQSFDGRKLNLTHASKLSRTFATLLEALDKHRGRGQQTITVVHQHVYAQAGGSVNVAGTVAPGEGAEQKAEDQPHEHDPQRPEAEAEPVADHPALPLEPALRCPESSGRAVPGAGDEGKETVPAARRQSHRRP